MSHSLTGLLFIFLSFLSVIYHLKLKGLIILSGGEDLEDLEPPYTAGGDVKCCGRFGKHFGCILKR